jgi:phosphoribosylformimino-5-aminoimidazole carboxamide ribotide isomerase
LGFEVLGVVDVRCGLAVRARGGRRDEYAPIERVAGETIPAGDAAALARQYVDRFGLAALYVADLDAIERRVQQHAVVRAIASIGAPVWLDAAISSTDDAQRALLCGASRVIVGLETLLSFDMLKSIVNVVGRERVVFSLDLREGEPIATAPELAHQSPEDLVMQATDAGVSAIIVLDLARVGMASGLDINLLTRVRTRAGSVQLYVGGGVRAPHDFEVVRTIGCAGALVASALLDGQITKRDLAFAL